MLVVLNSTNTPLQKYMRSKCGLSLVKVLAKVKDLLDGCEVCSHLTMMAGRVVFGPIVSQVGSTGSPEKMELFPVDTVIS